MRKISEVQKFWWWLERKFMGSSDSATQARLNSAAQISAGRGHLMSSQPGGEKLRGMELKKSGN